MKPVAYLASIIARKKKGKLLKYLWVLWVSQNQQEDKLMQPFYPSLRRLFITSSLMGKVANDDNDVYLIRFILQQITPPLALGNGLVGSLTRFTSWKINHPTIWIKCRVCEPNYWVISGIDIFWIIRIFLSIKKCIYFWWLVRTLFSPWNHEWE